MTKEPTLAECVRVLRALHDAMAIVQGESEPRAALARAVEVLERVQDTQQALYDVPRDNLPNTLNMGIQYALAWARGER